MESPRHVTAESNLGPLLTRFGLNVLTTPTHQANTKSLGFLDTQTNGLGISDLSLGND